MEYFEKMKALREDNDKSQQQIADLLGTSQSYYAQYENGKRPMPIKHIIALCTYYHISADYLLGLPKGLPYPERKGIKI